MRGGDIREFKYAGRQFDVSPDADVTLILGGVNLASVAAGNGNPITTGKRRLAGLDGLILNLDSANKDLEFLVNKQSTGNQYPYSITEMSGITYGGEGAIEGEDLGKSSATGNATIAIRGKKLEQI